MRTDLKVCLIAAATVTPMGGLLITGTLWMGVLAGTDPSSLVAAVGSNCTVTTSDPGVDTTGLTVAGLSADQIKNAGTIYAVAHDVFNGTGHEHRAAIVGIATALQESTLKNVHFGDRDSLGLFQQRKPWGSAQDRTTPAVAARMFYTGGHGGQRGLTDFPSWWTQPVTVAAQEVQVSAFPLAYAKWQPLATDLTAKFAGLPTTGDPSSSPPIGGDPCGGPAGPIAGRVPGDVGKMLQAAVNVEGTPYVWGGKTIPPGLDCSGLVVYSWGKAGHPMRAYSSQAQYGASDPVKKGEEQAGDLIFTEWGSDGPGHVLIVLDPAMQTAVEAPHTGDVVKEISYAGMTDAIFGRLNRSAFIGGTP